MARLVAVMDELSPCVGSDKTCVREWKPSVGRYFAEECEELNPPVGCTRELRLPSPTLAFKRAAATLVRLAGPMILERRILRSRARSEAMIPTLTRRTLILALHRIHGSLNASGIGCFAAGRHLMSAPCCFCRWTRSKTAKSRRPTRNMRVPVGAITHQTPQLGGAVARTWTAARVRPVANIAKVKKSGVGQMRLFG